MIFGSSCKKFFTKSLSKIDFTPSEIKVRNQDFYKGILYVESKIMKYFVQIAHGTLKRFLKDKKDCQKNSRVRSQKLVDYLDSVHISDIRQSYENDYAIRHSVSVLQHNTDYSHTP